MNPLSRTLGIAALVIGTMGCKDEAKPRAPIPGMVAAQIATAEQTQGKDYCSFSDFGSDLLKTVNYGTSIGVASADVDGDGDLDLIFTMNAGFGGQYVICENKMPQKGSTR